MSITNLLIPPRDIPLIQEVLTTGIRTIGIKKLDVDLIFEDSKEFIKGKIIKLLNKIAGTPLLLTSHVITYKIWFSASIFYGVEAISLNKKNRTMK